MFIQSYRGRARSRSVSCGSLSARYKPSALVSAGAAGGFHSRRRCPSSTSLAAADASARLRASISLAGAPSGTLTSNSTRNSMRFRPSGGGWGAREEAEKRGVALLGMRPADVVRATLDRHDRDVRDEVAEPCGGGRERQD